MIHQSKSIRHSCTIALLLLLISTSAWSNPDLSITERNNPHKPDPQRWAALCTTLVSWGTTDARYAKEKPATLARTVEKLQLRGWRGERLNAQWVVSSVRPIAALNYRVDPFRSKKGSQTVASEECVSGGFVRYVMTDSFGDGKTIRGCSARPLPYQLDSSLVADAIDQHTTHLALAPLTTQAGWLSIDLPRDLPAGTYESNVHILDGEQTIKTLRLSIQLSERQLPEPKDWKFHLDLWQSPFAIARLHQVELWSDAHFEAMRPYIKMYARAGGKVVTTSIMHKPWNGQTYDYFESMVTWIRRADGTWAFDFTLFDRWVEFMFELGIDQQINCYTMIPWKLSFKYLDQATNTLRYLQAKPGEQEYARLWSTLLKKFAAHLDQKGWLGKTYIAVDERPLPHMQTAIDLIRSAHKELKIAFAGELHPEILSQVDDYSVAFRMPYTEAMKAERRAKGQFSTFYTCCYEDRPNAFTFSPPMESEWIGWYCAQNQLDGYLRWALCSWVEDPLHDSRFRSWPGGDTYWIYPGARSSIRFERLIEGIQSFEKIRILRQIFLDKGMKAESKRLEKALSRFTDTRMLNEGVGTSVSDARKELKAFFF